MFCLLCKDRSLGGVTKVLGGSNLGNVLAGGNRPNTATGGLFGGSSLTGGNTAPNNRKSGGLFGLL